MRNYQKDNDVPKDFPKEVAFRMFYYKQEAFSLKKNMNKKVEIVPKFAVFQRFLLIYFNTLEVE